MVPPLPGRPVFCFSGKTLGDPERHAPRELTGVHVDRRQLAPRRLLTIHVARFVLEAAAARKAFVGALGVDAITDTFGLRGAGRFRIAILETVQLPHLVGVDEEIAELRIERGATPVHAAVVTGKSQAQTIVALRHIRPAELHPSINSAGRLELRRHRRDVGHWRKAARERQGLERERLRLRGPFERQLALCDRTLLDAVNGFARHTVEDEQQARLVDHRDGRDRSTATTNLQQDRRGRRSASQTS